MNLYKALENSDLNAESVLKLLPRPKPSNGHFTLDIEFDESGNYQLSIFDVYGKLYYREDFVAQVHHVEKSLNLQHLHQGSYIVKLSSASEQASSLFTIAESVVLK